MSDQHNWSDLLTTVTANVASARTLGAAAEAYAAENIAVFPLRPRTKLPATGHGFHDATTDPDRIRAWWRDMPNANIGARPPACTVVLDIDPRSGGDVELRRLIDQRGPLPATWVARTGGGGWHYWMQYDDGDIRKQLAPGVDLKIGATGYVVMPPSIHPSGERYEWVSPDGVVL
jgi:hypothetical protein